VVENLPGVILIYVILVYDVCEKRTVKILKLCRKYLNWVQNSVFEGEITKAGLKKLKMEINQVIVPREDSVIVYTLRNTMYSHREIIGLCKGGGELII
jgi:CRISPR-associated protein Cas2